MYVCMLKTQPRDHTGMNRVKESVEGVVTSTNRQAVVLCNSF